MSRRRRASPFSLFSFQDIITTVSGIVILIMLILAIELVQRKPQSRAAQTDSLVAQLEESIDEAVQEANRLREALEQGAEVVAKTAGSVPGKVEADLRAVEERLAKIEAELARLAEQEQATSDEVVAAQAERFDRRGEADELSRLQKELEELEETRRKIASGEQRIFNQVAADGRLQWLVQLQGNRILIAQPGIDGRPLKLEQPSAKDRVAAFGNWLARRSPRSDVLFLWIGPDAVEESDELRKLMDASGYSDYGFDVLGPDEQYVDEEHGAPN